MARLPNYWNNKEKKKKVFQESHIKLATYWVFGLDSRADYVEREENQKTKETNEFNTESN